MDRKKEYLKYIHVFREVIRRMSNEPALKPKDLSKILALAGINRELENKYGSHPYWQEKFDQLIDETLENDAIDPQRAKEYLKDISDHLARARATTKR